MKPRVLYIVTSSLSLWLLRGQARYLRERGFEVAVITSAGPQVDDFVGEEGVPVITVAMEREVAPLRDALALFRLWRAIRGFRPDILNVSTPKAGLLGALAGKLAGVPARIYTLRGLRLETARGLRRTLLATAERVAARCAHEIVCVSPSLRARATALGVISARKSKVLGSGSSNGVVLEQFAPTPARAAAAAELRQELGIPADAPVVGFVGRLTRDKGVPELVAACRALRPHWPELRLLLVGFFEPGDPLPAALRAQIASDPQLIVRAADAAPYYHAMDVLALPTHREGFPNVALEAAAAGKPIVAAAATGVVDAVVHGETGLLAPVGDAPALSAALESLLRDPRLARRLGDQARARVAREFARERVCASWAAEYAQLLRFRRMAPRGIYARFLKRALDFLTAAVVLLLLSPVLAALALIVRLRLGSPVLFRQQRPGWRGEIFQVIKFRTMTDARDPAGQLLPDADRLTRWGRLLRATSLDELPELWNVLRGEMSLVGPRPLLTQYLERYSPRQARRHEVRPGITGWAQVRGRNALTWEEKFELDVFYVEHCSFGLDVRILLATLGQVLRGSGVSQPGHATMPEFMGSPRESAKTT